ncbi:MAG: YhdP family protein [Gammaproteobacteria bacterium]|nr:YhdP family protein [Gammaproteobacteria bacterium]
MASALGQRAYHAALYLTGALVLLAAVAITGARLALPYLEHYQDEVETWASRFLQQTVSVDSLSAEWRGWRPRLLLRGVHLRSPDGTRNIISFDRASVEISPLRSLWKRQPAPRHIVISGLDVSVSRLPDGALQVAGIDLRDPERDNEFVKWLFGQERIEVQQTRVTWTDYKHRQAAVQFRDAGLLIRTDGDRGQVTGSARLPGRYGETLSFALDTTGKLWTSEWSGELYATTARFKPDSWYREYRPEPLTPAGGSANLTLWSRWQQARPVRVQGQLAYRDFAVLGANASLNVDELTGQFLATKLPQQNWHVALKLAQVQTENGAWPRTNIELVTPPASGGRYALGFDYLKLTDLLPLVAQLEQLPAAIRELPDTVSLRGELRDGLIVHDRRADALETLGYDVAFRNLDAAAGAGRPAVQISAGRVRGSGSEVRLSMNGSSGQLSLPDLYEQALAFTRMDGALAWTRAAPGWTLDLDRLHLENRAMALALRGQLQQGTSHPLPHLDLVAEIRSERLENMYRYLPHTPKFRIREWMQRTFHGGRIDTALAVLRGYPDQFPFRDNNGTMQAVINVSQGIVEYSHSWPVVDNVDAAVFFDNETLTTHISRGSVFNAAITEANGAIDDLTARPKIVLLQGTVKGPEQDLETFIAQSPLAADQIIKHANQSLVAGTFELDLDLSIPIKAPARQLVMDGALRLQDARLVSDAGKLELEAVNGAVRFTRESVDGRGLTARFAGQPVTLGMTGSKNSPEAPPAFVIAGQSSDAFIIEQLSERFPGAADFATKLGQRMSGATDWQARFIFEQQPAGLVQRLEIASDLYGLMLDLPRPLWKPTYSKRPLLISKTLLAGTPLVLDYGPEVHVRLYTGQGQGQGQGEEQSQEQGQEQNQGQGQGQEQGQGQSQSQRQGLEKLDIVLGEGFPNRPTGPGINLWGGMDALILEEWREALAAFAGAADAEPGFFSTATINAELETGLLNFMNQSFQDSNVQASRINGDWRVAVQGELLAGEAYLPQHPSPEQRLQVSLEKLVISAADNDKTAQQADPRKLPPIRAEIADFTYGDFQLGAMQLAAVPTDNGLAFEEIGFTTEDMTIAGTGLWEKPFNRNRSNFTINLQADKLHRMLDTFGYDNASVRAGKTEITIDAGWDGSPHEFSLAKMAGAFEMQVNKGRLLDVSPAAGRLFGLLSIQTLPRRLTLDFTDLFGKGLAFDRIRGNFNISGGNAYTNNLRLKGPSVDVLISGRTGLTAQDYDQLVTVTPQFADNLPIASALLGPVGIGVGAFLYLANNVFDGVKDDIDSILSRQYTITGNWYNPKIEKLTEPVAEQQTEDAAQPAE